MQKRILSIKLRASRIGPLLGMLLGNALTISGPAVAAPVGDVSVTGGWVRGISTDVEGVQVFKGIPFAAPTGGENRFRPPQPVIPWEGVKVADTWGDAVLQNMQLNPGGTFWGDEFYYSQDFMPKASESGLNLNVFTPANDSGDRLPVYVWIHGGANDHGNASEIEFWATKLAAKGVIVVPVQYRTGPLGFLSLPELSKENGGSSGNMAIQDLIKALQWVHDNIAGFGGTPENVTIGGQSAGARNVGMLLRAPAAKGLFRRAVMASNFDWLVDPNLPKLADKETENTERIEKLFGRPMSVADLRAIPADDWIHKKTASDGKTIYDAVHSVVGQYIIDDSVFTDESVNLCRTGALNGIDILIGSTADEYTSLDGGPEKTMTLDEFERYMQDTYGDGWQSAYQASDPQQAYRLMLRSKADKGHALALVSAQYVANRNNGARVYAYYFNHHPTGRNDEFYGSFHSSDLWFFFNSMRNKPGQRPWTGADHRMSEMISSYLANFIRDGDPNGSGLPQWPRVGANPNFIQFADGQAFPAESTPFPRRDAINHDAVLRKVTLSPLEGFS